MTVSTVRSGWDRDNTAESVFPANRPGLADQIGQAMADENSPLPERTLSDQSVRWPSDAGVQDPYRTYARRPGRRPARHGHQQCALGTPSVSHAITHRADMGL